MSGGLVDELHDVPLDRENQDLKEILEIAFQITAQLEVENVVKNVAWSYASKFQCEAVTVVLPGEVDEDAVQVIAYRGLKRDGLERMLEREGGEQIRRLERRLPGLLVIIGVEPMLGFLGTIVGLIKAFMDWEALGANITVSTLAAGIYQAMITTAGGLIVAIPYYICYHLLLASVERHARDMSTAGDEIIGVLSAEAREVVV